MFSLKLLLGRSFRPNFRRNSRNWIESDKKGVYSNVIRLVSREGDFDMRAFLKDFNVNYFSKNFTQNGVEFLIYSKSAEDMNKIHEKLKSSANDFFKGPTNSSFTIVTDKKSPGEIVCEKRLVSSCKLVMELPHFVNRSGLFEYFVTDPSLVSKFLFLNGSERNKYRIETRKFPMYKQETLLRSVNALILRIPSEIAPEIVHDSLSAFKINRIISPQTETGFWTVYMADLDSYMQMLELPVIVDNHMIEVEPLYGHCPNLNSQNPSKRFVFLYHKENLPISQIRKTFNLPETTGIVKQKYEKSFLYTLHIPNQDDYLKFIFSNGKKFDNLKNFQILFCDEPNLHNISTPFLHMRIPSSGFQKKILESSFEGVEFSYDAQGNDILIEARPKNMETYYKIIDSSFNVEKNNYHFVPDFSTFMSRDNVLQSENYDPKIHSKFDEIARFSPIPLRNFSIVDECLYARFDDDHFEEAFFTRCKVKDSGVIFKKSNIPRMALYGSKTKLLNRFKLKVECEDTSLLHNKYVFSGHDTTDVHYKELFPESKSIAFYKPNPLEFSKLSNMMLKEFHASKDVEMHPEYMNLEGYMTNLKFVKFEEAYELKRNLDSLNIRNYMVVIDTAIYLTLVLQSMDDLDVLLSQLPHNGNDKLQNTFHIVPGLDVLAI